MTFRTVLKQFTRSFPVSVLTGAGLLNLPVRSPTGDPEYLTVRTYHSITAL